MKTKRLCENEQQPVVRFTFMSYSHCSSSIWIVNHSLVLKAYDFGLSGMSIFLCQDAPLLPDIIVKLREQTNVHRCRKKVILCYAHQI